MRALSGFAVGSVRGHILEIRTSHPQTRLHSHWKTRTILYYATIIYYKIFGGVRALSGFAVGSVRAP